MVSNINEFEKTFMMNPFKVLGVTEDSSKEHIKKIYKKKCLLLHPDKLMKHNKNSNLEFQILNCAYNVVKKYMESLNKNYESLKLERKNDSHIDSDIQDIFETKKDFNKRYEELRENVQNPSDIGYSLNERTTKTTYDENDIEKPEKILAGKKFDNNKFNAIFEHLKNETKAESHELIKYENYYDSSLCSAEIHSYDGNVVYGTDGSTPEGFTIRNGLDYKHAYSSIFNPNKNITKKNIDYERKDIKKNMEVMSRTQVKSKLNKMTETVNVPTNKSRAEIEADFINNKLSNLRLEKEHSKKMVNKYKPLISYNSIKK